MFRIKASKLILSKYWDIGKFICRLTLKRTGARKLSYSFIYRFLEQLELFVVDTMQFATIPNGQQRMPRVGLGLWQIEDPERFEKAVETALELGYRHFDIAYTYKNERELGIVLKRWITAGKIKREDLFISTKLPQIGMHPTRVEHFLDLSLNALQMDYVNAYLLHFPVGFKYVTDTDLTPKAEDGQVLIDHETDLKGIWEMMELQVEKGKTRAIGLSNFNGSQVERVWNFARIKPSILQVELNLYLQQNTLLELCKRLNVTVVGYGNLGSPGRINYFKKIGRSPSEYDVPAVLTDPVVVALAQKYSKVPAQILLRFLIQRGVICIPKTGNPERLKQNIEVFDFELDEPEMEKLKGLDQGESARSFRMTFFKGAELHPEFPF